MDLGSPIRSSVRGRDVYPGEGTVRALVVDDALTATATATPAPPPIDLPQLR